MDELRVSAPATSGRTVPEALSLDNRRVGSPTRAVDKRRTALVTLRHARAPKRVRPKTSASRAYWSPDERSFLETIIGRPDVVAAAAARLGDRAGILREQGTDRAPTS